MSAGRAQMVLIQHLVSDDSMTVLAEEGVPAEIIPSDELRVVYLWAMEYHSRNGMRQAPSPEAMREHFANTLDDNEIDLDEEPTDTIEWAVDTLKSQWIYSEGQEFVREFARELAERNHDRDAVLGEYANSLVLMSTAMERRAVKSDLREDMALRLLDYEDRKANRDIFTGMRMGFPEVDQHTNGIHPGELVVLAAGPKVGKSMFLAHSALRDWESGRPTMLFTLENSVKMTLDRIICFMARIDSRAWQRGLCTPEEEERAQMAVERLRSSDVPFYVFQPDLGRRSFEHMISEARVREISSVYIDQLTFVELSEPGDRRPRHERIGDALHRLKGMISTGRAPISVMLAHQINREGVKSADKVGYVEMFHLAESAEVERTADWVFALYASADQKATQRALLQVLAARREDITNWELTWNLSIGNLRVRNEIRSLDLAA